MKHTILIFMLFGTMRVYAQNVGIGNADPKAALDIKGDLIFRVDTLDLIDGINDNIDIITSKSLNYVIVGPNTTFEVGGFTGGENGRIITLYNSSPAAYYVKNYSPGTLPENQINTGEGGDILMNSYSFITFQYLVLDNLWHIVTSNGRIESSETNTTLLSTQIDTSIMANFSFTTGITSILNPLNTMAGNTQLLGFVDDQSTLALPLPFNFTFDSQIYTHFSVCANGFMKLFKDANSNTICAHENDLNSTSNIPILAPFWDDLRMFSPDGGVWSLTEGNSPERIFHIEFICSYFSSSPVTNNLRFRMSIFENNNGIKYTYFQTANSPSGFSVGMISSDFEVISVDAFLNTTSSATVKNNNFIAPNIGRYYNWEQNLSSFSNISINTPLNDQSLNIIGDLKVSGTIINENYQSANLEAGWSSNIPAEYYKDSENVVHLNGIVLHSSGGVNTTIFKLPLQYTPKIDRYFTIVNSLQSGIIKIQPNGNVIFFSGINGNVCLDGISFRTR